MQNTIARVKHLRLSLATLGTGRGGMALQNQNFGLLAAEVFGGAFGFDGGDFDAGAQLKARHSRGFGHNGEMPVVVPVILVVAGRGVQIKVVSRIAQAFANLFYHRRKYLSQVFFLAVGNILKIG